MRPNVKAFPSLSSYTFHLDRRVNNFYLSLALKFKCATFFEQGFSPFAIYLQFVLIVCGGKSVQLFQNHLFCNQIGIWHTHTHRNVMPMEWQLSTEKVRSDKWNETRKLEWFLLIEQTIPIHRFSMAHTRTYAMIFCGSSYS